MPKRDNISMSVIRRLPRYYRFLSELKDNGVVRISSRELSDKMGFTASQIRQDLNCFGGFGQQGYGYIVEQLYNEIGNILGLSNRFNAILIGAGNLGRAVSTHMSFESRGFTLTAIFDSNESLIGKKSVTSRFKTSTIWKLYARTVLPIWRSSVSPGILLPL